MNASPNALLFFFLLICMCSFHFFDTEAEVNQIFFIWILCYYNKTPQTGHFIHTRNAFPTVLEARKPLMKVPADSTSSKDLFLIALPIFCVNLEREQTFRLQHFLSLAHTFSPLPTHCFTFGSYLSLLCLDYYGCLPLGCSLIISLGQEVETGFLQFTQT